MRQVAQTNLQLYNQMLEQQRPRQDIHLVRKAYDLSSRLSAGYYQGDGKPFICHGIGVASILCHAGSPAKFLAFGLIHNIYRNGDFGEGLHSPMTATKREFVRESVGSEVEELVFRFPDMRVNPTSIDKIEANLGAYDETERQLIAADLADHMEKFVDQGVLYFGDGSWLTDEMPTYGPRLVALARALGQPLLAEMMEEAFVAVAGREPMPDEFRPPARRRYLALTMPLSVRPRLLPRIKTYLRRKLHRRRK